MALCCVTPVSALVVVGWVQLSQSTPTRPPFLSGMRAHAVAELSTPPASHVALFAVVMYAPRLRDDVLGVGVMKKSRHHPTGRAGHQPDRARFPLHPAQGSVLVSPRLDPRVTVTRPLQFLDDYAGPPQGRGGMHIIVLFRDMPWHAVGPPAAKPSTASPTAYLGPSHGPPRHTLVPQPNPNLGAVDTGVLWELPRHAVGFPGVTWRLPRRLPWYHP